MPGYGVSRKRRYTLACQPFLSEGLRALRACCQSNSCPHSLLAAAPHRDHLTVVCSSVNIVFAPHTLNLVLASYEPSVLNTWQEWVAALRTAYRMHALQIVSQSQALVHG